MNECTQYARDHLRIASKALSVLLWTSIHVSIDQLYRKKTKSMSKCRLHQGDDLLKMMALWSIGITKILWIFFVLKRCKRKMNSSINNQWPIKYLCLFVYIYTLFLRNMLVLVGMFSIQINKQLWNKWTPRSVQYV